MKHSLYVIVAGFATGLFLQTQQNLSLSLEQSTAWFVSPSSQVWLTILVCVLFYLSFWVLYSLCAAVIKKERFSLILCLDAYTYLPSLLLMIPVLLRYNSFIFHIWRFSAVVSNDLQTVFIGVVALGIIWLKGFLWKENLKHAIFRLRRRFSTGRSLKFWQIAVVVFLVSACIYSLVGVHIFRSPEKWFSGDEPHYLLITHSLLFDRDLDLKNNLEEAHYKRFYPGSMGTFGLRIRGERIYPVRMIGLPVISVPFYYLGGGLGVVIFQNLLAAGLVVLIFRLAYLVTSQLITSLIVCVFTVFSAPLIFYSGAIYPEIPIALLGALAYQKIKEPLNNRYYNSLVIGLCIAGLPWLRERAVVLSLCLLILYIAHFGLFRKAHIPGFLVVIGSGALMFIYFAYMWYYSRTPGDISKVAVKTGSVLPWFFSSEGIFSLKICFTQGIPGLLFDQKIGLLFNAPIYFLIFPGIVWFLVNRKRLLLETGLMIGPMLILVASFYGFSGGESPPARYMVTLAPYLIMLVSCYLVAYTRPIHKWIFAILGMLSLLISYFMIKTPSFLIMLLESAPRNNLLKAAYSSSIDVARYFPSMILHEEKNVVLVLIYVLLIILFVGYHYICLSPIFRNRKTIIRGRPLMRFPASDTGGMVESVNHFAKTLCGIFFSLLIVTVLIEQVVLNQENILPGQDIENKRQRDFLLALDQLETFDYSSLKSSTMNSLIIPSTLSLTYRKGRRADPASKPPSFLTAGPYVTLPAGEYEANFWLKNSDNNVSDVVVTVEVVARRGKMVFARKPIQGTEFHLAGEIQQFTLPFELDCLTENIETRVFFHATSNIYLDKINIVPKLMSLRCRIADFLEERGDYDEAIKQYEFVVAENPDSSEIYYRLGRLYRKKGVFEQAISYLQQAIKRDNEHVSSYYQLGRVYEMQNNWSKAASEYQRALEKNPDLIDALIHLGRCYEKLGEVRRIAEIDEKLLALGVQHIAYKDDFRTADKFLNDAYLIEGSSKLWNPSFPGNIGAFPYKAEGTLIYKFQASSNIDKVIIEDVHSQWNMHPIRQWLGDIARMWTSTDGKHWTLRYDDNVRWGHVTYSQVFEKAFDDRQELYIKYYFYAGDPKREKNDNRGASLSKFSVDIYTKSTNH